MTCFRFVVGVGVATLLAGAGCTRLNPAFGRDGETSSDESGEVTDTGVLDEGSGEVSSTDSGVDADTDTGVDMGGTEPDFPYCSEGGEWVAIDMVEDSFVQDGPMEAETCRIMSAPGVGTGIFGPIGVECTDLNFGETPVHWIGEGPEARTGYLGRVDLEWMTGRGVEVTAAHYKFRVEHTDLDGPLQLFLAPVVEPDIDWSAGRGDGTPAEVGEVTFVDKRYPDGWSSGGDVFGAIDESRQLEATMQAGDEELLVYVPIERVQGWLDVDGRVDPGFLLWSSELGPNSFYISSSEGEAAPALWVKVCTPD